MGPFLRFLEPHRVVKCVYDLTGGARTIEVITVEPSANNR